MRWKCGFSAIEENFKDEKIQSIIDFWTDQIGKRINSDAAEKAASIIYAQHGLKAPEILCWESHISMELAIYTSWHGTKWVEQCYGKEIMEISNEYQKWLLSLEIYPRTGPKKHRRKNLLKGMNELRESWYPTLNLDTLKWVHGGLAEYYPRFFNRSCDSVDFHALHGALEPNEQLYSKNILSDGTAKYYEFNAPEQCLYFAKQDIIAYLSNLKIPDSVETGFRLLAKSCYTAIVTDCEFWISAPPKIIKRNEDNEIDCRKGSAIQFNDNSELYAVNGFPVPEDYVSVPFEMELKDMPYNCGMRTAFLECFGVKRYLTESNAVCVAKKRSSRLWNVNVANEVRSILEVDGKISKSHDGAGTHYYESYMQVKTFAGFEESLDEHLSFTIANHEF